MKRLRFAISAALLLGLAFVGALPLEAADQGRLQGTVVDAGGKPIEGAKITLTSPNSSYKQEKKTDKKGKFLLVVVDAARTYELLLEKEGFIPMKSPVKLLVNDLVQETYTLQPVPQRQAEQQAEPEMTEEEKAKAKELEAKGQAANTYNEGVRALNGGDTATAIAKFKQASEIDPNLPEAYGAIAEVYLETKQYDAAIAAVDRYLQLQPNQARGLILRYDILKAKGDKAATQALDALVTNGGGAEAAKRIYNYGADLVRNDKTDDAIVQFKRAIELDPNLTQAQIALGNLYMRRKDYKNAVATVDRVIASQPNNLEALTIRYESLKAAGDKAGAQAAQAAMKGATSGQSPEATFKQGVTLYNAGNVAEARAAFERVLAADPNYHKAHYLLGLTQIADGKIDQGKASIEKFIKAAPNDPDVKAAKEILDSLK